MATVTDKVPPVPTLVAPLIDLRGEQDANLKLYRFENAWLQWFQQVKIKIDVINENLYQIGNISGSGFTARDGAGNWHQRVIQGIANQINVTNGDGVAGNPTISISNSYIGQASITTLGTITVGTWNGTVVGVTYGGTGASTPAGARANLQAAKEMTVTSTSATGGSATALPAQPVGYVEIEVSGVVKKIAYYDS